MSFGPAGAMIQVRRARLRRGVAADRERLRLALDPVRPAAAGVPDRAILIIPRLVARRSLPRHGDSGLFAGDVVESLRAALRRARRPGEARSPEDSLLFVDELDAAVWLIEQWLAGAPPAERDWWPHLTAGAAPPVWWRRAILPDGRRLPSVIARLVRLGVAEPWLRRLDPGDVRVGLAAIAETHGLSLPAQRRLPVSTRRPLAGPHSPDLVPAVAFVEAIAPEARRSDLPPAARLLMLIGLIAERRPAMLAVRTAALAFAAVAAGNLPTPEEAADPPRPRVPASSASAPTGPLGRVPAAPFKPDESRAPPSAVVPAPAEEIAAPRGRAEAPPRRPAGSALADRRVRAARARSIEAALPAPAIRSDYGGLLFLLNALLALGVYGDFSEPRRSLPGLSPFGMLRLLGRAWFGAPFAGDPLHGLLTRLAGGRSADAAREFEERRWSVPRAWLLPWPDSGPALLAGSKRRPMLWHPAGFPLAELDGGDAGAAVRAARRLGLRGRPSPARLAALPVPPRARWLACLRFYLEARVSRALSCGGGIEAVTLLCRQPARISADDERVEARFALRDHPIAIRLAGLDPDPGWIPAAGRDFRYIFE